MNRRSFLWSSAALDAQWRAKATFPFDTGERLNWHAVSRDRKEDVLKIIENDSGEVCNPELYYFVVFGTPSDTGTWG